MSESWFSLAEVAGALVLPLGLLPFTFDGQHIARDIESAPHTAFIRTASSVWYMSTSSEDDVTPSLHRRRVTAVQFGISSPPESTPDVECYQGPTELPHQLHIRLML